MSAQAIYVKNITPCFIVTPFKPWAITRINLSKLKIHFVVCAAHKLHGPKGVGFLHVNHRVKIKPMIYGGSQERNMRGGTENVYGIIGLAKALEIAYARNGCTSSAYTRPEKLYDC